MGPSLGSEASALQSTPVPWQDRRKSSLRENCSMILQGSKYSEKNVKEKGGEEWRVKKCARKRMGLKKVKKLVPAWKKKRGISDWLPEHKGPKPSG